jgi:hypothetical protein
MGVPISEMDSLISMGGQRSGRSIIPSWVVMAKNKYSGERDASNRNLHERLWN